MILVPAVVLGIAGRADSEILIAVETGRGEYEKEKFSPGKPEFAYRFEVDEQARTATLTEIVRLANQTVIDVGVQYVITASEDGSSRALENGWSHWYVFHAHLDGVRVDLLRFRRGKLHGFPLITKARNKALHRPAAEPRAGERQR
jgi:hypothetical protein